MKLLRKENCKRSVTSTVRWLLSSEDCLPSFWYNSLTQFFFLILLLSQSVSSELLWFLPNDVLWTSFQSANHTVHPFVDRTQLWSKEPELDWVCLPVRSINWSLIYFSFRIFPLHQNRKIEVCSVQCLSNPARIQVTNPSTVHQQQQQQPHWTYRIEMVMQSSLALLVLDHSFDTFPTPPYPSTQWSLSVMIQPTKPVSPANVQKLLVH